MQEPTSSITEEVFAELRKTIPNIQIGLPTAEEIQRRRSSRLERERLHQINRRDADEQEFQRLKARALSHFKKGAL